MIDLSPRVSPRSKHYETAEAKAMEPDYAHRAHQVHPAAPPRARGLTAMALNFVGVNRVKKQRFSQMLTRQSKVGGIERREKSKEDDQIRGFRDIDIGKKKQGKSKKKRKKDAGGMHFGGAPSPPPPRGAPAPRRVRAQVLRTSRCRRRGSSP